MSEYRPKIGITQGDINGVGWEVILKILADSRITEIFTPVVYGSLKAAKTYMPLLDSEEGEKVEENEADKSFEDILSIFNRKF